MLKASRCSTRRPPARTPISGAGLISMRKRQSILGERPTSTEAPQADFGRPRVASFGADGAPGGEGLAADVSLRRHSVTADAAAVSVASALSKPSLWRSITALLALLHRAASAACCGWQLCRRRARRRCARRHAGRARVSQAGSRVSLWQIDGEPERVVEGQATALVLSSEPRCARFLRAGRCADRAS